MATAPRLAFALDALRPVDWARFETFCGMFFATEFDGYRSVGGTNDRGLDGEIFTNSDKPGVVLQY